MNTGLRSTRGQVGNTRSVLALLHGFVRGVPAIVVSVTLEETQELLRPSVVSYVQTGLAEGTDSRIGLGRSKRREPW